MNKWVPTRLITEEINHSYDGGLYGELIQNLACKDDANAPAHWSVMQDGGGTGAISLDTAQPLNSVRDVSLKLDANGAAQSKRVGAANDGYWGVPIRPNTTYRASFYAKASPASPAR